MLSWSTLPDCVASCRMAKSAVVNASPLIYLGRADLLNVLRGAADEIVVPDGVAREILVRGDADAAARALKTIDWLKQVAAPPAPAAVLSWDIGPGESAVLSWALSHPGCLAVIDDLLGRRCAEALRVPLCGTLGLVLRARKNGTLPLARPVILRLRAAGMYLSDGVMNAALAVVGE